jgi:TetR/AcrR family transcriptional regulator, transcriptional repressor for nem operon
MGRPATDKRERLVNAAIERFHKDGYANTSLADVAKTANVPLGNVFYYFKTKKELATAVIDAWCQRSIDVLTAIEQDLNPLQRLHRFLAQAVAQGEIYVTWGCPLAALVRDLGKEDDVMKEQVSRIHAVQYQWLEAQFRQSGFTPEQAQSHSRFLMAGMHGSILLAYAQSNESLIAEEVERLTSWLQGLES